MSEKEKTAIPQSEIEEVRGLTKFIYKAMKWMGLTSGVGLIAWGGWWFIWSMINYFTVSPINTVFQQILKENYFNQAQLSAILVALGVLIMEIKRLKTD